MKYTPTNGGGGMMMLMAVQTRCYEEQNSLMD